MEQHIYVICVCWK